MVSQTGVTETIVTETIVTETIVRRAGTFALLLTLAGCGDGGPALHPAAGAVRFVDGTPVAGATVEFLPTGGGPAARGRTDADGRFALATADRPGAVAGPHRVGVVQAVLMDGFAGHVRHMGAKQVVPSRFNSPRTSGLSAQIARDGNNDFAFTIDPDRAP